MEHPAEMPRPHTTSRTAEILLNKVPRVTVYFWVIKVLCTTVGETAADFLNLNLGLGLNGTSVITGMLLAIAIAWQFKAKQYYAPLYWLVVVLVSIVGTLITDNLTDNLGVPLEWTTLLFAAALALTFTAWYASEHTLSIHTIYTRHREAFYWLAVLLTFALGTAAGDLMAERLDLGYFLSATVFAAMIGVVSLAFYATKRVLGSGRVEAYAVLTFWVAYILTRPLGASLGDYLAQPAAQGGAGMGATYSSGLFLLAIGITVVYLTMSRQDVETVDRVTKVAARSPGVGTGLDRR